MATRLYRALFAQDEKSYKNTREVREAYERNEITFKEYSDLMQKAEVQERKDEREKYLKLNANKQWNH